MEVERIKVRKPKGKFINDALYSSTFNLPNIMLNIGVPPRRINPRNNNISRIKLNPLTTFTYLLLSVNS